MNQVQPEMIEDEEDMPEEPSRGSRILRTVIEFLIALAVAILLTAALRTFVVQPFMVPSGSMEPTIMVDDRLLTDMITFRTRDIQQGDIVVFTDKADSTRILVKRVIATGGQTVDLRDGQVYVDDKVLYEPYTMGKPSNPHDKHWNDIPIEYPFTVPEGCLWLMGDNRTNSLDSRYFGAVEGQSVIGRAFMVFWPIEEIGLLE